jgi:hypothetical protein
MTDLENKPTYEELNNIASQAREERKQKHYERIRTGRDDAIKHITEGAYSKMTEAAANGFHKVDIYSFCWVKDPAATCDENGNKTVFEGNVRLLDLITKSKRDFISSLNSHFNKDEVDKYHCGIYKKKNDDSGLYSWNIFVSWAPRKEHNSNFSSENSQHKTSRNENFRGRGGRGGRGGRSGRGGGRDFSNRNNKYKQNI